MTRDTAWSVTYWWTYLAVLPVLMLWAEAESVLALNRDEVKPFNGFIITTGFFAGMIYVFSPIFLRVAAEATDRTADVIERHTRREREIRDAAALSRSGSEDGDDDADGREN